MAVTVYTKAGADAAIAAAVQAVQVPAASQGGGDGVQVLVLPAGASVPAGTKAGTLVVRVIA
ncbi:hypothetical protein CWT12_12175 [Actinomyces sp. 432]|uniref:hypothetical protein n=1 Tax=Actinomyces sp. 432 TaxID=2057798 RepID=UPI001374083C|nr:hypothetical protein [Actinomyces sp. 432]QHO91909.1 hypothetical protein CWT12_12175 [Actinomyces sp. 432]